MVYLQEKDRVQREGIEIFDGLFVGGRLSAMNYELLKTRNVQGILNVTTEVRLYFPDSGEFEYLRVAVNDAQEEPISDYFNDTYQFIQTHLNQSRGVLVHCQMGQSRSCSVIVACKYFYVWSSEHQICNLLKYHDICFLSFLLAVQLR